MVSTSHQASTTLYTLWQLAPYTLSELHERYNLLAKLKQYDRCKALEVRVSALQAKVSVFLPMQAMRKGAYMMTLKVQQPMS